MKIDTRDNVYKNNEQNPVETMYDFTLENFDMLIKEHKKLQKEIKLLEEIVQDLSNRIEFMNK